MQMIRSLDEKGLKRMRRMISVLLALLTLGLMPVVAQDKQASLQDLAAYLPANTQLYAAFRVDEATIDQLNNVLDVLAARDNAIVPPGFTLNAALDDVANGISQGSSFDSLVRPWIGDTFAFALVDIAVLIEDSNAGEDELVILVSVSNRDEAAAFIEATLVEDGGYTLAETGEVSLYTPVSTTSGNPDVALWDDAMLFSVGQVVSSRPAEALTDISAFGETLAGLTAPLYGGVFYIDTASIIEAVLPDVTAMLESQGIPAELSGIDMLDQIGPQAIGFALLDSRSLSIDFYQRGLPETAMASIDLAFLDAVPADSALVLQSSNLGPSLLEQLSLISLLGDFADERLAAEGVGPDDDEVGLYLINDIVAFIELSYRGLSGQALEEAIGWMSGNFAAYQRFPMAGDEPMWDMGVLVENTNPEAAAATLAGMLRLLDSTAVNYTSVDNGVLIGLGRLLNAVNPGSAGSDMGELMQFFIGTEADRFIVATMDGLNQSRMGSSLSSDPTFNKAAEHFLPESSHLAYLAGVPLREYSTTLARVLSSSDAKDLARLLNLIESASISSSFAGDTQTLRFVLTLAGS